MKRFFIIAAMAVAFSFAANAQKYALVDMEYILKNIPQYEMANEQLNQVSLRWQKEVETLSEEAATLYKNYQSEKVFLTDEQKLKREEEIVNKEKEAAELRKFRESLKAKEKEKSKSQVKSMIKQMKKDAFAAGLSGWNCEKCGRNNPDYIGTCACGSPKPRKVPKPTE